MHERWSVSGASFPLMGLWVAWVWVAGFVMGFACLQVILADGASQVQPQTQTLMLWVALAPAGLSATVAALVALQRRWQVVVPMTFGASLLASALCAPVTYILLTLAGGGLGFGGSPEAGELVAVTVFGAFFGIPLGVVFGGIYAVALGLFSAIRDQGAIARLDATFVMGGLVWFAVGAFTAIFPWEGSQPELATNLGLGLASLGAAACLLGAARWQLRRWFLARVRAGRVRGWSVEPIEQVPDATTARPMFPVGPCDGVLVRREQVQDGPFRDSGLGLPVARVAR